MQTAIRLTDQPNHDMSLAEVSGTQKSSDARWNGGAIKYWGVTDLLDGKGTPSTGHSTTEHGDKGRDFGTFEGKATTACGNTGLSKAPGSLPAAPASSRGSAAGGTFKTKPTSPTDLAPSWQGSYEFAKSQVG